MILTAAGTVNRDTVTLNYGLGKSVKCSDARYILQGCGLDIFLETKVSTQACLFNIF